MSELRPTYNLEEQAKVAIMLSRFVSEHIILEYQYPDRNLILRKEEVRLAGLYDVDDPAEVDREVAMDLLLDAIDPSLN